MTGEHFTARARRVVTGTDEAGRSILVSDGLTETRFATAAYTDNQIWQATSLPSHVTAENTLGPGAGILPPPEGYTHVLTSFPPDAEWDLEAGYAEALAAGGATAAPGDVAGMHTTDTIDIVTVISGEIWLLVDEGETLLRSTDSVILRGVRHAWRNRGTVPCVVSAVHIAAVR